MVSPEEIAMFAERFPRLRQTAPNLWKGTLEFHASFEGSEIRDEFEIELELSPAYLPQVREVGGRTQEIAQKYALNDLRTLHCNRDSRTVCLCVKQEEKLRFPPGSTLVAFVEDLVVPYFFGLSFFEKNGYWLWGEYSHGALGILEYAAHDEATPTLESVQVVVQNIQADKQHGIDLGKQFRRLSNNRHCPCGSLRPFRRCHADAWRGLLRTRHAILKLGLDLRDLFPD